MVDDFERALDAMAGIPAAAPIEKGVRLTYQALLRLLADGGVAEIPALGEAFDPNLHEAVAEEPSADRKTGEILEVLSKGYRRGDTVLRPSKVKVAKGMVS